MKPSVLSTDAIQFQKFAYCPRTRRLRRGRQTLPLRPTAARVLECLLHNALDAPHAAVSKDALRRAGWPSGNPSDQSVFQVLSELRRALKDSDVILTDPNAGYRMGVRVQARHSLRVMRAATLVLGLLITLIAGSGVSHRAPWDAAPWQAPPLLGGLADGVALLERGRARDAEVVLHAVLNEQPQLTEARLLLAESLLAQARMADARRATLALIDASGSGDHIGVAALALMSRIEERAGHDEQALHWALVAVERAAHSGSTPMACTVVALEQRIDGLMTDRPSLPEHSPWHETGERPQIRPQDRSAARPLRQAPAHCARLRDARPQPDASLPSQSVGLSVA
ncbi:MAG: hypothetical protein AAF610_11305 [Pseudomonadota bacterium]